MLSDLIAEAEALRVTALEISAVVGRQVVRERDFDGLGDVHATGRNLLSYIKDAKFAPTLNANRSISGVLCRPENTCLVAPHIHCIECEDPNLSFFKLVDGRGRRLFSTTRTLIDQSSTIHNCHVAEFGVRIGANCTLEPNVVIRPGVHIGNNVKIRAGAVLGLDTFQHQRSGADIFSPRHDGVLVVEDDVEIGSNSCISRGFSYRATRIKRGSRLDALTYLGHGAEIGEACIVCAGVRIMGHSKIGDATFIGPNATVLSRVVVGDKAAVSLGAVVTKDVPNSTRVTGNFAVEHSIFLRNLRASLAMGA